MLARSRPEDKHALVVGLRERGNVVAVTGDGTNDAPALLKADIGFAMGITGTEVVKEVADIIQMDDSFTGIVEAVKWGRNTYDSIQKMLMISIPINVVTLTITFVSITTTKEEIISANQMLWMVIIKDVLAIVALLSEAPVDKILQRQPNASDSNIMS